MAGTGGLVSGTRWVLAGCSVNVPVGAAHAIFLAASYWHRRFLLFVQKSKIPANLAAGLSTSWGQKSDIRAKKRWFRLLGLSWSFHDDFPVLCCLCKLSWRDGTAGRFRGRAEAARVITRQLDPFLAEILLVRRPRPNQRCTTGIDPFFTAKNG